MTLKRFGTKPWSKKIYMKRTLSKTKINRGPSVARAPRRIEFKMRKKSTFFVFRFVIAASWSEIFVDFATHSEIGNLNNYVCRNLIFSLCIKFQYINITFISFFSGFFFIWKKILIPFNELGHAEISMDVS